MKINYLRIALLFALLSVVLGAFGAHALKELLSEYQLSIFETGVRYQFYHALAVMAAFALKGHIAAKQVQLSSIFFTVGILLFSGSLYILACSDLIGLQNKSLVGPLTPLGGICFIIAWAILLWGTYRTSSTGQKSIP